MFILVASDLKFSINAHDFFSVCATGSSLPYTSIAKKAQEVIKTIRACTISKPIPITSRLCLGPVGCQAPIPPKKIVAAVSSHGLLHCITFAWVSRRPSMGLKRFDMALAHASDNIQIDCPAHTVWC